MMQIPVKTPRQLRHEKGLFTVVEVAQQIGVRRDVIDYHVKHGRCVAPTVQINGQPRKYYANSDVIELAKYFAGRRTNERQPPNVTADSDKESE